MNNLSPQELERLIFTVFAPTEADRTLLILVDVPNAAAPDNAAWRDRRMIAHEWHRTLTSVQNQLGFQDLKTLYYENVESNNADLPELCYEYDGSCEELHAEKLATSGRSCPLNTVLAQTDIAIAPTEFSATAPLKLLARQYGFRAATLPGFSREMIPALGLDYVKVHERVMFFKRKLDDAVGIKVVLSDGSREYASSFDLRFRTAHASSGLIRERGTAGNLPSGEAYIVPNEGEKEQSQSEGLLPVQFGEEVVVFKIEQNRAIAVLSKGSESEKQLRMLQEEPAYGNIAEVGLGVLGEFGVTAVGNTLLDEKLGLHIASGRSDHFGGITGPNAFSDPKRVVHIDWVYVPSVQPKIKVKEVKLLYSGKADEVIMKNGKFLV